jgi:hypothetical protein
MNNTAAYLPSIDQETTNILANLRPKDVLVLSSRHFSMYATPFVHVGVAYYQKLEGDKGESLSEKSFLQLWGNKLEAIAKLSADHGASVVFIKQPPEFPRELSPSQLCQKEWYRPLLPSNCILTTERSRLRTRFMVGMSLILRKLQQENPSFFVYDPFDQFCPPSKNQCSTVIDGILRFSDNDHLSMQGSLMLEDSFTEFLRHHGLLKG